LFYYQFNIGDYLKHTAHLTPLEDIAYRRLLDTYYDTEKPIPNDIPLVSRRLRIDAETVEMVLKEFFLQTEEGYRNKRADTEIEVYHAFLNKQKANGIKGGRPKNKPIDNPPLSQAEPKIILNTNREPLNTNREPITTGTSKTIVARSDCNRPETVSEQVWSDFQTLRRAKKAPITNSAISKIDKEAGKAGILLEAALIECCARGWTGFKADWMKGKDGPLNFTAANLRLLEKIETEERLLIVKPLELGF
jgi:hypothetical protein